MDIRENTIVSLGYGKYVRSDKIIALDPIEDNRGPGRRTHVYVEQVNKPIIASRTETSILTDMVETPKELMEARASLELLKDIYDDIHQVGPMLRKSIKKEAQLDLDKMERRIEGILKHEIEVDFSQ